MAIKDKVFNLTSQFIKELPTADEIIDNIFISGYASVNTVDRVGDVVPSSVWEQGMVNYLKNPIVLAYHDHDDPVGRMVEHKIDDKGLWIKARISAAAEEVFNFIKDGVLTAFSVSFRVLDAEYKPETELFIVKELELIEISVVSVPANSDTLFSLSKSFDNNEEYKLFKTQFALQSDSAKGLEASNVAKSITSKEIGMDPKELQAMLDTAAANAAKQATDALIASQKAEKDAAEKALADEEAMQKRVAEAVAKFSPSTTGAEKLYEEIENRYKAQAEEGKKTLEGLEATIKEKAAELEAITKSKMKFSGNNEGGPTYQEKEKAILLGKMANKNFVDTKYGKELIEKYGAHVAAGAVTSPQSVWELEVSTNMEAEMRRRLVVAPLLRQIQMQTNVMMIPVNQEAGFATWMANSAFGTTTSAGSTQTHQLKEITLSAYKVATNEYLAYEEEEDSILAIMPIVRDAMIRRIAKAVDKAFLRGAGAAADPVKGLVVYDTTSAVNVTSTSVATVSTLRALRKDLGAWGLDPAEMFYIVSTDVYYDLLDDTTFQTMDKVGTLATILTGQIGMANGSPVLVSDAFDGKVSGTVTAATNIAALAVAPANFLVGNQRGMRFDTQELVETQRRVLVSSLRTGMTQISTVNGQAVSVLRWS
jgi:HK97 family phage prohead protease/HK97 family phage major capsid protein